MSGLTRFFAYAAAFVIPPLAATLLGFRALARRDHPAPLAPMTAERLAAAPRPPLDSTRPTVVVVLGADLTEITDAVGPYEMFARSGRFDVVTAAPERQPTLLSGGLRILPHYSFAELDARLAGRVPAVVVVPNIPNVAERQNRALVEWMQRQAAAGALMHSWCKGAMAFAHAGFLDGRTATAHWGDIPTLEKRYPRVHWVRGVRWVDHGQLVMSAGITSGVDASLRVIGRLAGDSVARRVASEIRYPNHRFAIDPKAEQYALRPADLVLLANAAFRFDRSRIGVALYPGVGEIDLSNLYDAHVHTMVANVETVAERDDVVVSAHGLTLLPSLALSSAEGAARARRLGRLAVPGTDGRERAAGLAAAASAAAPALGAEYLHDGQAHRFGLEPVLEDLARTADVPTATFALRRLEYRTRDVKLAGSAMPWGAIWPPLVLGALGVLLLLGASRLTSRRWILAGAVAAASLVPAALPAQQADAIPAGTRIRVDLHTTEVSRLRRIVAQPLTGALVAQHGDTILLAVRDGADPIRVPRSALRDLYVSRGRPGRAESALRRAVLPALASAAYNALAAEIRPREDGASPARAALSGAATSAAIAGTLGALFPKERWSRVQAPATRGR